MNKLNVIFWSGTGNTELMAECILKGCGDNTNAKVIEVSKATLEDVKDADILFLGCPSMGDEELEESEMAPFMESIYSHIKDKKIILFGSYGWGDGEWMRDWENKIKENGGVLIEDSIISNYSPSEDDIKLLKSIGAKYSQNA